MGIRSVMEYKAEQNVQLLIYRFISLEMDHDQKKESEAAERKVFWLDLALEIR